MCIGYPFIVMVIHYLCRCHPDHSYCSSWKFNGLAGIVTLLTAVIVLSGIVGRYIYTAIPRTVDGTEIETVELDRQIAEIEILLQKWFESQPEITRTLTGGLSRASSKPSNSVLMILGRSVSDIGYHFKSWRIRHQLKSSYRARADELVKLLRRKRALERQQAPVRAAGRVPRRL